MEELVDEMINSIVQKILWLIKSDHFKTKSRWSMVDTNFVEFWLTILAAAKKAAPAKKAVKKTVAKKAAPKKTTTKSKATKKVAKKAAPKKKTTTKKTGRKWVGSLSNKALHKKWRVLFEDPVNAVLSDKAYYSMFLSNNKRLYIQPMFFISTNSIWLARYDQIKETKRELEVFLLVDIFLISVS